MKLRPIKNFPREIWAHIRRMARARRLGAFYYRSKTFKLPAAIIVSQRLVPLDHLNVPEWQSVFLEVLLSDAYGLSRLGFVPDTILDIGANVGLFSLAARYHFPSAVIHAYEPNPRIRRLAEIQASNCGFILYPEAVGAHDGLVNITEPEGHSLRAQTIHAGNGIIKQTAFRSVVDRFKSSKVDLVKIDCEGAEWELFEARDAWQNIRAVRMEYHSSGSRSYPEAVQALASLGFVTTKREGDRERGIIWAQKG